MTEAQKECLRRFNRFNVITDHGIYFFVNSKRAEKLLKHHPKATLFIPLSKEEVVSNGQHSNDHSCGDVLDRVVGEGDQNE